MSQPPSAIDPDQLARVQRRDPDALRQVAEDRARPLYRATRGMGFSQVDAEDLVQDVFATFMTSLDRFEGRSSVNTWVFGILYRKVQERRRAQSREAPHDPIDEVFESQFDARGSWITTPVDVERHVSSTQLGQAIRDCVDRLPDGLREVFELGRCRISTPPRSVRFSAGRSLILECSCIGRVPA